MREEFMDSDRFGDGFGTDAPEAEVSAEQGELAKELADFQTEFQNEDNKADFAKLTAKLKAISNPESMRTELSRLSNKLSEAYDVDEINEIVRSEVGDDEAEDDDLRIAA
jgi:hypothetical protein